MSENRVVKRYITRGKVVTIITTDDGWFAFKINDKCNQKEYYSQPYDEFNQCEKDSYKVVKAI